MNFHQFFKSKKNRKAFAFALVVLALAGGWSAARIQIINFGRINQIVLESPQTANDQQQHMVANSKSKRSAKLSYEQPKETPVSCDFTYLKPGEEISQFDPAQFSLTSKNPIVRIYNKVSKLNQLQRELNGLPSVPMIQLRPASMQLQCPDGMSESDTLQRVETDLDENLTRLEKMLAGNPTRSELVFAQR